jgi:hypothetical protein
LVNPSISSAASISAAAILRAVSVGMFRSSSTPCTVRQPLHGAVGPLSAVEHDLDAADTAHRPDPGLATRYDKLAITYRAAALLAAICAWLRHLRDTP